MKKGRAVVGLAVALCGALAVLACTGEDAPRVAPSPDGGTSVLVEGGTSGDVDASTLDAAVDVSRCESTQRTETRSLPRPAVSLSGAWSFQGSTGANAFTPQDAVTLLSTTDDGFATFVNAIEARESIARITVRGVVRIESGGAQLATAGIYVLDGFNTLGHVDLVRAGDSVKVRWAPSYDQDYDTDLYELAGGTFATGADVPFALSLDGAWADGPTVRATVANRPGTPLGNGRLPPFPATDAGAPALSALVGVSRSVQSTILKLSGVEIVVCRTQ